MIACLDMDIAVFHHFEFDVVEQMGKAGTEYAFQDDRWRNVRGVHAVRQEGCWYDCVWVDWMASTQTGF